MDENAKEAEISAQPAGAVGKGRLKGGRMGGPGRAKGKKNQVTGTIKEAISIAIDRLGGAEFFFRLGSGNAEDRRTLAQIAARLIPSEIQAKLDHRITVQVVQSQRSETTTDSLHPIKTIGYDPSSTPPVDSNGEVTAQCVIDIIKSESTIGD